MNQLNLFEHKWNNDIPATLNEEHFENYLDVIWKNRPRVKNWYTDQFDEIETDKNKQRFIQFRAKEFSSRNYVGVIRYDNTEINHICPVDPSQMGLLHTRHVCSRRQLLVDQQDLSTRRSH